VEFDRKFKKNKAAVLLLTIYGYEHR